MHHIIQFLPLERECSFQLLSGPSRQSERDNSTQEMIKISPSQPVKRFKTSAVEVPKTESPASPPKEAPKPVLLLSCMRIVPQSSTHNRRNKAIDKKYKKVNIFKSSRDDLNKRVYIKSSRSTSTPSTSMFFNSSAAFAGFTDPPYKILTFAAASLPNSLEISLRQYW